MIEEKVLTQIATRWQTTRLNIGREYVQTRFLTYFFEQKLASQIFFKGGTALRLLYQSPRFSEDLDFSATLRNCHFFEDILQEVLIDLQKEGIELVIEESKETSGGCLALFTTKIYDLLIKIKTDLSLRSRNKLATERVIVKTELSPPFLVNALSADVLVSEKLQAFLTRQKPRDFFDIYILLRHGLGRQQIAKKSKEIMTLLGKVEPAVIRRDLKPLLPKNFHPILSDFKVSLSKELERVSVRG